MPRRSVPRICGCACGNWTAGGEFLPGHDARYRGDLLRVLRYQASTIGNVRVTRLEAEDELRRRGWLPEQIQHTRNRNQSQYWHRELPPRATAQERFRQAYNDSPEPEVVSTPFDPSALDWATRTYGVEIEFYGCTPQVVEAKARELHAGVLDVRFEQYNHHTRSYWKIVTDQSVATELTSSVRATGHRSGLELVSPILHGESGLREIERVCQVLVAVGAKVNRSCGLHVHHGARDLPPPALARVGLLYHAAQAAIDSILPASRRSGMNPIYCLPISDSALDSLRACGNNRSSLVWALGSRYRVINFESLARHGTVEFRQHSGTIEYPKIAAWVRLTQAMLRYAVEREEIRSGYPLGELLQALEIGPAIRDFFRERQAELVRPPAPRRPVQRRQPVRPEPVYSPSVEEPATMAVDRTPAEVNSSTRWLGTVSADTDSAVEAIARVGEAFRRGVLVVEEGIISQAIDDPGYLESEARRRVLDGTTPRDPAHAVPQDPGWTYRGEREQPGLGE